MTERDGKIKQLDKAYSTFIDIMLSDFPLDLLEKVAAPDVMGFGTAIDEKILGLKELKDLAIIQQEQSADMNFRFDKVPVFRKITNSDNTAVIVDEIQITMEVDEEKMELGLRLSTVMDFVDGYWKVVHWHGSKPEYDSGGTDSWHKEEWNQKNEELKRLVDEKTVDLENKNRELEVEAALERIRAQVTAMKESSDLLDIVVTMNAEFNTLGHEAHYFWHMRWLPDTYEKAMTSGDGSRIGMVMELPRGFHENAAMNEWEKNSEPDLVVAFDVDGAIDYVNKMISLGRFSEIDHNAPGPEDLRAMDGLTFVMARTAHGEIGYSLPGKVPNPPEKDIDALVRFAGVFDLAYRRFEDLKNAELQNRETQIELAIERVRARTMAMHKSEELPQAAALLFKEFKSLGKIPDRFGIVIYDKEQKSFVNWATDQSGIKLDHAFRASVNEPTTFKKIYRAWKEKKDSLIIELTGKKLEKWIGYVKDKMKLPIDETNIGDRRIHYIAFHSNGCLIWTYHEPLENNFIHLFVRFAKVFEQTYIRFLDLKLAEEQARESQIELSLERVRARSMAMHQTSELQEVINVVHEQFNKLNMDITGGAFIAINTEIEKEIKCWGAGGTTNYIQLVHIPFLNRPIYTDMIKGIKKGPGFFSEEYTYEEKNQFFQHLFRHPPYSNAPKTQKNDVLGKQGGYTRSCAVSKHTTVFIINHHGRKFSEADNEILRRIGNVFEQSYTRFLDLEKAEEQAREARIEASLERIRSRALGMQSSEEVGNVNDVLFEEFYKMGIEVIGCGIAVVNEETDHCEQWRARQIAVVNSFEPYSHKKSIEILQQNLPQFTTKFMKSWKKGDPFFHRHFNGKERKAYLLSVASIFNYSEKQIKEVLTSYPDAFEANYIFYKRGWLSLTTSIPLTAEEIGFSRRFVEAFDFAHTRFYDLKKAEDQAKEAQIEAALERIRAQAMAMQHSSDLVESAFIVFEEFEKLNLSVSRCGIGIIDPDTADCELWSTVIRSNGKKEIASGRLSLLAHPMLKGTYDAWLKQQSHAYTLEGEELADYYKIVAKSGFKLPTDIIKKAASLPKQYYYNSLFGAGGLYVISNVEPSEKEKLIIHRFSEVFHLTYTRYQDLQKAESQAIEAVKQASLDRVRGEIASMRTSVDLQRITPLIWKELETLEVPFIRCGVFIVDESASIVNVYLTTPDGKPLGALHLPFDATNLTISAVDHWRKKSIFTQHWDQNTFIEWMQSMVKIGQVSQKEYQDGESPPESLDLHFIPFDQGMLYVGNDKALKQEEIELVQSLANTFAIAYSRYEDFKNLEVAMSKVEQTLSELKSTQSQLVHSEKMASLGELTAGIAHEIQNPLNFVNNFAEVSVDLMEEMNEEMTGENNDEVIAISNDLKQNLEKIQHHGQRASSIVKGMLEHSRAGDGHKEPTDINELADEYLRLAYHGLRAKDKSFQSDYKANLSEGLPKINAIPQDIGRVLLNLINNAFYAVSKKTKAGTDSLYKPLVTVSTKKLDQGIEIRVKDNGEGIPQPVQEKIFQPFFTTKPTGEGTGLGLSLSFDIITKGHGGEILLESKEGIGTEFIITLP